MHLKPRGVVFGAKSCQSWRSPRLLPGHFETVAMLFYSVACILIVLSSYVFAEGKLQIALKARWLMIMSLAGVSIEGLKLHLCLLCMNVHLVIVHHLPLRFENKPTVDWIHLEPQLQLSSRQHLKPFGKDTPTFYRRDIRRARITRPVIWLWLRSRVFLL